MLVSPCGLQIDLDDPRSCSLCVATSKAAGWTTPEVSMTTSVFNRESKVYTNTNTHTNTNVIFTTGFTDQDSHKRYKNEWPGGNRRCWKSTSEACSVEAVHTLQYLIAITACAAICNHVTRLETISVHFTCPSHVEEGWGAHSFAACISCKK